MMKVLIVVISSHRRIFLMVGRIMGDTIKKQNAIVSLFSEEYPSIRTLKFPRSKQNLDKGSFHNSEEMGVLSLIDLEMQYSARNLLNLLRGRTFPGHPACWFRDGDEEYEVRIEINKRKNNSEQI